MLRGTFFTEKPDKSRFELFCCDFNPSKKEEGTYKNRNVTILTAIFTKAYNLGPKQNLRNLSSLICIS